MKFIAKAAARDGWIFRLLVISHEKVLGSRLWNIAVTTRYFSAGMLTSEKTAVGGDHMRGFPQSRACSRAGDVAMSQLTAYENGRGTPVYKFTTRSRCHVAGIRSHAASLQPTVRTRDSRYSIPRLLRVRRYCARPSVCTNAARYQAGLQPLRV
jgi:hypothetical protein